MKPKNIIILTIIVFILAAFVIVILPMFNYETKPVSEEQTFDTVNPTESSEFSDGLPNPTSVVTYHLD